MTPTKLCVVAAFGLSAAACSYSNTTTTAAVPSPYRSGAEQACVDYGFNPGTDSYNRCVVREAQSRAAGRMPAVPERHHPEGDGGLAEQAGEPLDPDGDVAAGR